MSADEVRLARAYLLRVAEPPAPALFAFVERAGPVVAAARVRAGDVPAAVRDETSARCEHDLAEGDLARADAVGARLVVPEDPEWPGWPLLCLANASGRGLRWATPPLALWVRGSASLDDVLTRSVAVVGARSATSYGEHVATEFGYGLAEQSFTVVSGAAHGIDGAAHRGALAAGGNTIAVMACGVDVPYPASHSALLARIARDGAIVSEYPPSATPAKYRFLVRNRLIAAMGAGTVVVEAGVRSGARNTAASAAALGKVVLAVPGPVESAMSRGCHELLRTGAATLVSTVPEVLEAVGQVGDLAPTTTSPKRPTDGLGDQAIRVHDALSVRTARGPDQIATESGVPLDRVRALLPELELTGLAHHTEEGWRRPRT
ncbi:DNA-processing protein DprA [Actinokineospora sp. NBRC 105648]|uniref:DNA-processing protein DprA n=1 Tax=Actinokineospora sp. NBRC 105648 TaxID=3032206 RepID=UPI0024A3CE32|nr:DNA-processing protein DprA [Actinokineospora sp. NBRC 105648]GLZ41479.1 DNA processing protein DprA [Actinokineospora sp. NBRC 105648]